MQCVMALVLAGTMGLAALVDRNRQAAYAVSLSTPVIDGDLSFQLPARWQVSHGRRIGLIVREASEPARGDGPAPRQLTIFRQRLDQPITPLEYLQSSRLFGSIAAPNLDTGTRDSTPISFGGWPGIMLAGAWRIEQGDTESVQKTIVACAVLPNNQAVTIRLDGQGLIEQSDEDIVRQVAGSVHIAGAAPPPSGGSIELSNGARFRVPDNCLAVPESDPDRTSRQLVGAPGRESMLIELSPVETISADTANQLRTALSTHDTIWLKADGKKIAPGQWKFMLPDLSEADFPRQAYAGVDADGRGLLAIFHAGAARDDYFDSTWNTIAAGLQTSDAASQATTESISNPNSPRPDPHIAMLAGGSELVRGLGRRQAQPSGGDPSWWLLADDELSNGWSVVFPDEDRSETRYRTADGHVFRVTQRWIGSRNWRSYAGGIEVELTGSPSAGEPVNTPLFIQQIDQHDNRIQLRTTVRNQAKPFEQDVTIPSCYVPAAWLSVALAAAPAAPIILMTDRVPGLLNIPLLFGPLTILVAPTARPSKVSPPAGMVLHGIQMQVSGSGTISRWYFRPDGELDQIDFPGGSRMVRSDAQTITQLFHADPQLNTDDVR
jgi:hypothetical protein